MDYQRHPIDIVMLGTFAAWRRGTIQSRALPFARQLRRNGYRPLILTTPWDVPGEAETVDILDGVPIIHTAISRGPLASVRQMTTLINRLDPQVIHLIKPKGYGGLATRIAMLGGSTRAKVLVDADDWEGDGGWNDAADYNLAQRLVFEWQERDLLARADHVIAASSLIERRTRSIRGAARAGDVTYIPNGLDDEWLDRLGSERRTDDVDRAKRVVLYSRFVEFTDNWVPAFAAALANNLNGQAELLLVGASGTDRTMSSADGEAMIRHAGYVPRSKIPQHLGSAGVAVYPYNDSLITRAKQSVKLMELMAAGCAIVASDVGEVGPALGETGRLVHGNEPESFAGPVAKLLGDKATRNQLGVAAKDRVRRKFATSSLAAQLLAVYQQIDRTR